MKLSSLLAGAALVGLAFSGAACAAETVIGGIVFQQDMFMRGAQLGMEATAKNGGATLLQGNSESKPEKEADLIGTFVSRGAKAIVVTPISAKASIKALQAAHDKGVKIVLFGTHIDADFPVAFIGTSDADIGAGSGKTAAQFIKDKLGGKANVALIGFKTLLPEQSEGRTNGFLAEAKNGAELNIVTRQDAWLTEKAVAVVGDVLTAHPEINVIYAANEGGTVGAVQAVRRAGKQGKVFVFGTDGSEQLAGFLNDPDGVLIVTTAQQPFAIGKTAMETALASIAGQPVEKSVIVPVLPLKRGDKATIDAFVADAKKMQ